MTSNSVSTSDPASWSWSPGVGYGPFHFGMSRDAIVDRYNVEKFVIPSGDDDRDVLYDVVDCGVSLDFESERLSAIHLFRSFRVDGREIVGMRTEDVIRIDRLGKLKRTDSLSEGDCWLVDSSLGLRLCIDDGIVDSAIVRAPEDASNQG